MHNYVHVCYSRFYGLSYITACIFGLSVGYTGPKPQTSEAGGPREDPDMAMLLSHEHSANKCLGHVAVYIV